MRSGPQPLGSLYIGRNGVPCPKGVLHPTRGCLSGISYVTCVVCMRHLTYWAADSALKGATVAYAQAWVAGSRTQTTKTMRLQILTDSDTEPPQSRTFHHITRLARLASRLKAKASPCSTGRSTAAWFVRQQCCLLPAALTCDIHGTLYVSLCVCVCVCGEGSMLVSCVTGVYNTQTRWATRL